MKKKKKRVSLVGIAFVLLLLLVVFFLARLALHRPPEVTLPDLGDVQSGDSTLAGAGQEAIRRVEVTPETVQLVIERLSRPENYSRTVTVERYWSDGSGQTSATVSVADGWTRVDTAGAQESRHTITGGGRSWIWYGSGGPVYTGAAVLSSDEEQSIPTYEDILRAETSSIAVADYRVLDTVNCIYVETAPDPMGYVDRWWVGVDNGLLVAAEREGDSGVVYRMAGLDVETGSVTGEVFRLPDGEALFEPRGENEDTTQTEG